MKCLSTSRWLRNKFHRPNQMISSNTECLPTTETVTFQFDSSYEYLWRGGFKNNTCGNRYSILGLASSRMIIRCIKLECYSFSSRETFNVNNNPALVTFQWDASYEYSWMVGFENNTWKWILCPWARLFKNMHILQYSTWNCIANWNLRE